MGVNDMSNTIEIEKVENGYIVKNNVGFKTIYIDIEDLFKELMLSFEGKSEHFLSCQYAKIYVSYEEEEEKYICVLDKS